MSHLHATILAASSLFGPATAPLPTTDLPVGFAESIVLEGLESPAALDFTPDGRLMVSERVAGHLRLAEETPA
ncbi:MAG: glucose/arabinose dehydrogenase, partial [Paracoccaceae bacterium]